MFHQFISAAAFYADFLVELSKVAAQRRPKSASTVLLLLLLLLALANSSFRVMTCRLWLWLQSPLDHHRMAEKRDQPLSLRKALQPTAGPPLALHTIEPEACLFRCLPSAS
jgi:hypothetical protein